MKEIITYIVRFLIGENTTDDIISQIGYCRNYDQMKPYKVVIKASSFFDEGVYGTPDSMPALPLKIWEESPILFGAPTVEEQDGIKIIHADIVASTYFLISRYEELINRQRDVHGRLPGKESLPYRAGFIDSPLVDEYGKLLRAEMRGAGIEIPEPEKKISKIYLTHDIDQLSHYRNFRGFMGGMLRGLKRPSEAHHAMKSYLRGLKNDPWYTLPWLFKQDNALRRCLGAERCEPVAFIKVGGGNRKEDKPFITLHIQDFLSAVNLCKQKNITLGVHSSYEAGINPHRIADEKKYLEKSIKQKVAYNRHHFLTSREPADMQTLIQTGITDDFTLGYADVAGFRLGTCRAVRWINPVSRELTKLTLHPLTIMDSTLSDKRYMFLNRHDAYEYCLRLINMVENWNGELILLWHNTSVEDVPNSYHRHLYESILNVLKNK